MTEEEKKLIGHKLGEDGIDLLPPTKPAAYQGETGLVTVVDLCPRCYGVISPGDNFIRYMGRHWHLKCFEKWKGRRKINMILERAKQEKQPLSDEQVTKIAEEMGLRKSYVIKILNEFSISHTAVVERSFKERLLELVQKYREGDKPLDEEQITKIAQELNMPKGLVRYWLDSLGIAQEKAEERKKAGFLDRLWQATKECAKDRVLRPQEILELMKRLNAPSPNWIAYYLRSFEAAKKCKLFYDENGTLVRIDIFEE
jgi:transcriptional regulator with XRE-family HTH domain